MIPLLKAISLKMAFFWGVAICIVVDFLTKLSLYCYHFQRTSHLASFVRFVIKVIRCLLVRLLIDVRMSQFDWVSFSAARIAQGKDIYQQDRRITEEEFIKCAPVIHT